MNRHAGVRLLIAAASFAMLAAVVAGMWAMGSPAHQRALRLDEFRVADLARLSSRIENYWAQHKQLPADLRVLDGAAIPDKGLANEATYEYAIRGEAAYQLCAVFNAASEVSSDAPYHGTSYRREDWTHSAGKYCFIRDASVTAHGY